MRYYRGDIPRDNIQRERIYTRKLEDMWPDNSRGH